MPLPVRHRCATPVCRPGTSITIGFLLLRATGLGTRWLFYQTTNWQGGCGSPPKTFPSSTPKGAASCGTLSTRGGSNTLQPSRMVGSITKGHCGTRGLITPGPSSENGDEGESTIHGSFSSPPKGKPIKIGVGAGAEAGTGAGGDPAGVRRRRGAGAGRGAGGATGDGAGRKEGDPN